MIKDGRASITVDWGDIKIEFSGTGVAFKALKDCSVNALGVPMQSGPRLFEITGQIEHTLKLPITMSDAPRPTCCLRHQMSGDEIGFCAGKPK